MLKKLLTAATALVFTLVTLTLVVLLGTVTHADAVRYADWVDATQVTDPLPGQLYAISGDGVIEAQLCPLTKDDFDIGIDALSGRTFVNRLGEAVPAVIWVAQTYFQTGSTPEHTLDLDYRLEWRALEREFAPLSSLAVGLKRILSEREMEQIERHGSAAQIADAQRLEGCATAILQTFQEGRDICQLTEVIRERSGRILAVRFATRCLALDPEAGPRPLPALQAGSFWTGIKLGLGLVDQQLVDAPVLVGASG
jgi:hypothetical protein